MDIRDFLAKVFAEAIEQARLRGKGVYLASPPRPRSGGDRAHKRWKRSRAAGRN